MRNKDIISKMTLEEKCSFFSGKDFWQTLDMEKYGIPSLFLADGPTGVRKQKAAADHLGLNPSYNATCFPTAATMANSWDEDLCYQMGAALGGEARDLGVNILLGPGMNIKRNPRCGRNFEYFSEDPFLAGKCAAAIIRGIQSNGISACVKHFAVNSQEERRMVIDAVVDERTLREIYLTGFEIAVKEGKPKSIMSSYNSLNGDFTNENPHLLKEILRDEWGFDGVVVTDWGGENDRVEGLKCGNELEMPGGHKDTIKEIIQAVKDGKLDESVVDENLDRFLSLVFDVSKATGEISEIDGTNHAVAQACSEKSIVLLKNNSSALPIVDDQKVAVIGNFAKKARYQGAGSSIVNPTSLDNIMDCIGDSSLNIIGYEDGYDRYGKKNNGLIKKAMALGAKADTILLFLGLDEVTEAEGLDRVNIKLPAPQLALAKQLKTLGKKIVVVMACGSCVELEFADDVDAIVHGYLTGQAGAHAIINVLTGKVNPSGKLTESYPFKYEDCSTSNYFPGKSATVEHREGMFVGYRYYDKQKRAVQFPFGYGMSYTKFEYSDITCDGKSVSFTIANVGDYDGEEVAQVYVGIKDSNAVRCEKELKGFKKVFIAKGEKVSVTVPFDDKTFRFFNVDTNAWDTEKGTYTISVGSSCEQILLSCETEVEGSVVADQKSAVPSYANGDINNLSDEEFTALIGREIPDKDIKFIINKKGKKTNRIVVDYNTTVLELKYARGWTGRFFAWGVKFGHKLLTMIGKRDTANLLVMGTFHLPMRGLSRLTGGAIAWTQLNGLITMFNGKFFKGLGEFLAAGKAIKKEAKAAKKAEKEAAKLAASQAETK